MSIYYDNSKFQYINFYNALNFSNYINFSNPSIDGENNKFILSYSNRSFGTNFTIKPTPASYLYYTSEASFSYFPKISQNNLIHTSGVSFNKSYPSEITTKSVIYLKSNNIFEMQEELNNINSNTVNDMVPNLTYDYFYSLNYNPTINLMDFTEGVDYDSNYIIINGNTVYNNTNDGKINKNNKRNILYDNNEIYFNNTFVNFSTRKVFSTTSYGTWTACYSPFNDIDYRISKYAGTWSDVTNSSSRSKQLNCHLLNAQFGNNADFNVRYKIYGIATESYSDWQARISGISSTSYWSEYWPKNIVLFVAWHKKDLEKFLLNFGVPFTLSKEEAETKNTSDFESPYINPDNPVNPGTKAEGYPENEQIDLNIPKSSPSGGNGSIYILNPTHLNYVRKGIWDEVVYQSFWGQGINPFDYIVGLWWYPFSTYDLYGSQISYKRVKLGSSYIVNNDVPGVNDGATINLLDGGKLHVPIMTDSYLDYEPYTSYNLFIPYIGFQSLNSQDIVGKELRIKYFVNIYDGTLTAFLFADNNLINTYEGVVGVKIPMSNYDTRIQTLQFYTQGQQMLSRASQVISGGVGAASNFGVFGSVGNVVNAGTNIATNTLSNIFDSASNKANQAINAVNNNYGTPYGLPGIYAPQTAYLKIETSLAAIPSLKIGQEGKNASISGSINGLGLSGFVKSSSSTIITAAGEEHIVEEEKVEIDRLIKGGVVING